MANQKRELDSHSLKISRTSVPAARPLFVLSALQVDSIAFSFGMAAQKRIGKVRECCADREALIAPSDPTDTALRNLPT
jgi:hypothetical protein